MAKMLRCDREQVMNLENVRGSVVAIEKDSIDGFVLEVHRAPLYFRNPFIHKGYRIHFSFLSSLLSTFTIHNETFNIWTALVPALWFLHQMTVLPEPDPTAPQKVLILYNLLLNMAFFYAMALIAITIFHIFHCMSQGVKKYLAALDYAAIALISYSSFLPSIELWHYWDELEQHQYWTMMNISLATGASMLCCFQFVRESRLWRTVVFTSLATLPFIICSDLESKFSNHAALLALKFYLIELAGTIVLGVVFFLSRIP